MGRLFADMETAASASFYRSVGSLRSEEHTSELQSHRDLHSFPTRRSSDLAAPILLEASGALDGPSVCRHGDRRKRQFLQIGRIAWPPVPENRNRSIYVRQLT